MEEFLWRVLSLTAKRGYIGASREDFFREIRGTSYSDLEEAVLLLEREGYINLEWVGPNRFVATITEPGSALVRDEYERRIEAYRKSAEEAERKAKERSS